VKETIYKVATLLAVVSILPFIIFVARRELPPEKFHVETHKKQLIKDFVLESRGEKKSWILRAPEAVFEGKETIILKRPKLLLLEEEEVTISAKRATYHQEKGELLLENVRVDGKNIKGKADRGIYRTQEETFLADSRCTVVLKGKFSVEGKSCLLDFKNKRVIIRSEVKSAFREGKG